MQHIATFLGATCCVRLTTMLWRVAMCCTMFWRSDLLTLSAWTIGILSTFTYTEFDCALCYVIKLDRSTELAGALDVKVLANEDTLLRTHRCRHKCFLVCPRAQHLLRTQILCPGHKKCFWFCSETLCVRNKCFPVCAAQETSWATMCSQQCVLVCQGINDLARTKRIYILIIKDNKLFSFLSLWWSLKEIENMFSVFLSSEKQNTRLRLVFPQHFSSSQTSTRVSN